MFSAVCIWSVTAKVLKIMSPGFMQLAMCAVCAQIIMVAPPTILHFVWQHFRLRLILCHYINVGLS